MTTRAEHDEEGMKAWNGICQVAADRTGISLEQAKSILEDAGYGPHGNTGILEAVNVVLWQMGKPELTSDNH